MVAVFDVEQITLNGAVPSQAAADQVLALVVQQRLMPASVVDNLTIDPDVPASAGIRIVMLNAVRFDDVSDVISDEHAQELDRIVALMNEFPNVRIHVVGNTDQRGDETRNFVISQRRAEAVVTYLVGHGIDRSRLTTEPGGESNPLTLENSAEADSLNRRTEFVIYGFLDG